MSDIPPVLQLPLVALRNFDAAARLGSFKAAAAALSVSPAAVSHQIKALEERLGALLFERVHRGLKLTPTGERLAEASRGAFSQLEQALDALSLGGWVATGTTLSVSAAPTFAMKWLAPRLHLFQAAFPRIELRLRAEDVLTDPGHERQVDVAIRYGAGPYAESLAVEPLWPSGTVFPVCSPALAAELQSPDDLLNQNLLRTATPIGPGGVNPIGWLAWLTAAGIDPERARAAAGRAPLFGTTQLALDAATAGRGLALSPAVLVLDDLAAGRLAKPFPLEIPDPYTYWLLVRRERAEEARIRAFVSWVKSFSTP